MTQYPADHAGLEILPFDRCLQLLTTVAVGRVSFFAEGEIVVLPVNHLMDGQDPVFRSSRSFIRRCWLRRTTRLMARCISTLDTWPRVTWLSRPCRSR